MYGLRRQEEVPLRKEGVLLNLQGKLGAATGYRNLLRFIIVRRLSFLYVAWARIEADLHRYRCLRIVDLGAEALKVKEQRGQMVRPLRQGRPRSGGLCAS